MLGLFALILAVAAEPQMSVMTAVRAAMESAMGSGNQSSVQSTIMPKEGAMMGPWAPNLISMEQIARPVQMPPILQQQQPQQQQQQQQQPVQQPQLPQQSQSGNTYPAYYLPPSQSPPHVPPDTNFYPPPVNNYGSPPTTEFRSEQYTFPIEPAIPYPLSQPPSVDPSLVPTARHFVIVSFIGLLLLFAVIQNSIAAAKRKDALVEILSNRRKRQLDETLTLFE
ncbi:hypothetical protein QAD02_016795 [Eretmocerus hayati]|uniref:Uncharacterized protein n=1 Tax=Eretmocerus hayati TaxID=131215 RepID=A0ACC2PC33_9HYME|nr:hypothetical protein QAD02_016795 [Eretmocerus hayati]